MLQFFPDSDSDSARNSKTKVYLNFFFVLHHIVADNAVSSLAYAELYLTLSAMLRRFHLELFDTTSEDIEAVCDAFMPMPKEDSKGVRVMVSSAKD